MNKNIIKNLLILLSLILFLSGCKSGRPDMAYEQEDGGAVQDIKAFNPKSTAENFRESTDTFADDVKDIMERSGAKPLKRRVSLNPMSDDEKETLEIIDHNKFVKKLETSEVSLKLNDMDIKSALKLFASLVQRNIIIGEEVSGNITIDFDNIKWGSAVYAILDINNLVMIVDNDSGLLRVHSKEVFVELEKSKIERTLEVNKNKISLGSGSGSIVEDDGNIADLKITEIFKVYHATSGDLIEPLENVLGDDADVTLINDESNNQLLVKGTPEQLNLVESVIDKVDIEKKQVLIEAYIINATDNFNENFNNNLTAINASQLGEGRDGITYTGVTTSPSSTTSTEFLSSGDDGIIETKASTSRIFSNETLSSGAVLIGNIGITRLKAVISMSINDKNTEVITNPKLFAMDGETATLTQGTTLIKVIPASGDAAGSTIEIPQNLTISVTPQIMGESAVKLELTLNNDKPGEASGDDVATTEESITSMIKLDTEQVAVLGGVYTNTKNDNNNYVPFFSKVPILGTFFRSETKVDTKTQLLIFISANIV